MKFSLTKDMLKKMRCRRGVSLIEILIALSVLVILASGAGMLVSSALTHTTTNRQKLIAMNLAREGIEIVRRIRNTNVLRYPLHRAMCWNAETIPCDTEDANNNTYLNGTYIPVINPAEGIFALTASSTDPDAASIAINASGQYVQGTSSETLSLFSREITITYVDASGNPVATGRTDFMRVTAAVSWTYQNRDLSLSMNGEFVNPVSAL